MRDLSIAARTGKYVLLAALLAYAFMRGVLPALTAISDDFPEYFTSAKIVRDGGDTARLYDDAWFREQTRRYGVRAENPGDFTPYPPPTALVLVPLAGLEPLTALRVVTVLNLVCVIISTLLLGRIFAWRPVDSALFILLSGWALHNGLRFGHPYILVSTSCLLGYYLYRKGMPWLAGLCLGIFVPIKYYPAMILAAFALRGQWRVLLGGCIAVALVAVVSIGALGWKVHQIFLFDVLWEHLTGHLVPGPRFTAQFQSFDTLFERLFIPDAVRNPHPWFAAPTAARAATLGTKGLLLMAAVAALVKLALRESARAIAPTIGILGILVFLIAPGSGTYAFVLLWLPVALLIDYFVSLGARLPAYLILGIYALIGFIPYGHTYRYEGDGALTVLAYPRLLLMLAMFAVCLFAVAVRLPSGRHDAPDRIRVELQNV